MTQSIQGTLTTQLAGTTWQMLARCRWPDESLINGTHTTGTDGIVDVTLRVYELSSDSPLVAVYAPSNLTTGSVLTATLTAGGAYWTRDTDGYNFRHALASSNFTHKKGSLYLVVYTFNPHASNVYGPHKEAFLVTCA